MAWNKKDNQPRQATEDEYVGWFEAAELRKPALTREKIIEQIKQRNSFRWWRINHDYKWLQKQMKKMGLNPDEAKELL